MYNNNIIQELILKLHQKQQQAALDQLRTYTKESNDILRFKDVDSKLESFCKKFKNDPVSEKEKKEYKNDLDVLFEKLYFLDKTDDPQ